MIHTVILYSKTMICLLCIGLFSNGCSKEEKISNGASDRPYSQYMLTDYGSYIEVSHDETLNAADGFTLEGWVRLDNIAGSNILISKKPAYKQEGYVVSVGKLEGEPSLYSYLGYTDSERRAGNFPIHQWTHWAVTFDGTQRRHYINGDLAGEFTEGAHRLTPTSESLFLAKTVPANTGLAEFRLWNTARSEAEIKRMMNKNIIEPKPGLIAVWPLHENARDIVGGHDGTLYNNPHFKKWED